MRIDKNGLMRLNEEEIEVVQKIYKAVQCDNKKFPYMTGDPKFAMRKLNFKVSLYTHRPFLPSSRLLCCDAS